MTEYPYDQKSLETVSSTTSLMMIDELIAEIKDQNCEIVALRSLLTEFMKKEYQDDMKADIFSSLYPQCISINYEIFVNEACNGVDPFDDPVYSKNLRRYAAGKKTSKHPLVYLKAFPNH